MYDQEGRDARAYLAHVEQHLARHRDAIPELALVAQAPHELTRAQLHKLRRDLAAVGITEDRLRQAHSERAQKDLDVSLLALLRHHLGHELLLENRARVARAMRAMLDTYTFDAAQKQALERIAARLQIDLLVDPADVADVEDVSFAASGTRADGDQRFDGDLAALLAHFERALWQLSG